MKRELNGTELGGFVKERQAKAVRGLKQHWEIAPKLAIIRTNPDPIVDSYMKIKTSYGEDIGVIVEIHTIDQNDAISTINQLNMDKSVHGTIIQIPLPDRSKTSEVLNSVAVQKDVDGLAEGSQYDCPTPVAITWLLAGYDIDLKNKKIVIVGHGRLVGKPLAEMWQKSGYDVEVMDRSTSLIAKKLQQADILVSATGVPGLITPDLVKPDALIVDAGVATDKNGLVGDVAQETRDLPGIIMTPIRGGVGPLTVAALFENVITATRSSLEVQ